jgi:hypothetical protein
MKKGSQFQEWAEGSFPRNRLRRAFRNPSGEIVALVSLDVKNGADEFINLQVGRVF